MSPTLFLCVCVISLSCFHELVFADPTPVVMWHGMGKRDSCCNVGGLGAIISVLQREIPGIYVTDACNQIANDEHLQNGYHAIGRAVAQRCPSPPMKNFISIGGQHQDSSKRSETYVSCEHFSVIQAQYWHNPLDENTYRDKSIFLAEINNEKVLNQTYIENLQKLQNMVLIKFTRDSMVVPPESSWFGFYAPGQAVDVIPLQETELYKNNKFIKCHTLAVDAFLKRLPHQRMGDVFFPYYLDTTMKAQAACQNKSGNEGKKLLDLEQG
ncbi:palmitoyl-protein thioesterase 3 [Trichinella spiralis]|uniref:palmitoyl-protein thioesterase 3 n=1 Tax=Trichinella spiralis TaxID=6334 RepID=UPI0001EFC058|nr:palmitoyl-protein thioesterase 3 [Trichinella spiralis]